MSAAVLEEDYEELRLGLVLNGGLSLAVWMGGVVTEIDRLRRGDGAYGEVLDVLASTARVDVIAGASAGGLNGGLLATAIAHGRPLTGLRTLWVSRGGFESLFRSPFARNPPSLMDGDGYFLVEVGTGLRTVAGPPRGRPAGAEPVHLTMVMSVLTAVASGLADDFGAVISDATHLGAFTFRRDGQGYDDWDDPEALDRVALAARSSASFPFAFEPSFVPVNQKVPGRPDMAGYVNFPSSRFVVDGGALMNKPFRPALDAIYAQPATRQVRRALLYVAPDPGGLSTDRPDDITQPPGLATAILASAMTMPRTESVAAELKDIRAHNDAVTNLRLVRDSLSGSDPCGMAELLFEKLYLPQRTSRSVDEILRRLDAAALDTAGTAPVRDRNRLRTGLMVARRLYLPDRFPPAGSDPAAPKWQWGIATVEGVADAVLDLLKKAMTLAPLADQTRRAVLRDARGAVHRERLVLAALRELDDGFWECESPFATSDKWAESAFERWETAVDALALRDPRIGEGVFEALARRASAMAGVLVGARATLLEVAEAAGGKAGGGLAASVKALAPRPRPSPAGVAASLRALLGLEVVLTAFTAAAPTSDQFLQLMLISGNTPNAFDARRTVEEKLNGVNLGHFGAFYKASWRANDWMFGRLDGAWHLSQVLLSPARLRQMYRGRAVDAFDLIEAVVLGTTPGREETDDVRAYLADAASGQWDRALARSELDFLDALDDRDPIPVILPECARGLARRLQLGLLSEELPNVAAAVRTDLSADAAEDTGGDFITAFPADLGGRPLQAKAAVDLFGTCRIGTEKIAGEFGSDLLTTTIANAAAVSVNAVAATDARLGPIRAVLGALRVAVMVFVVLARAAVGGTRTAFAVMMILLTAGGLVLALPYISSDVNPPLALVLAGAAAVLAGGVLAWMRSRAPARWWVFVVLTAAGFIAPLLLIPKPDREQAELEGIDAVTWLARPVLAVAALIVVPWVVSAVLRRLERRRTRARVAGTAAK